MSQTRNRVFCLDKKSNIGQQRAESGTDFSPKLESIIQFYCADVLIL